MGDIAEMMLDGTLCQSCGEYIGRDSGYPMFCAGCNPQRQQYKPPKPRKGKAFQPFVCAGGSKVSHRVNPATGKSFCQFENNWQRGAAIGGTRPLFYMDAPKAKPCKNCDTLAKTLTA